MTVDRFVWYELVTRDVDAALGFYGRLLGWEAREFPGGEGRYVIVSAKGKGVGGVMALPEGMGEPFWLGYVGTSDIDAAVAKFTGSGGTVHRGPWDIPNVGRLALVSDPQGAGLALFQGASDQPSEAFNQRTPGHGNWHELRTPNPDAAFEFYAGQFGWTRGDAMPMDAMGTYQLFKAGGAEIGGIMKAPGGTRPMWLYYFGAASIDEALGRITNGGGTVLHGPSEVPGGA
ncbi:MAG TPA: VOC family protein, partial [Acetobacteraceae bacterium]|nr:VOC family protein [Acetobacteraceae bacterium]